MTPRKAKEDLLKVGRPTSYTKELGDLICDGVTNQKSIAKICAADGMPNPKTVYRWFREFPAFSHNYDRAKEDQASALVEDALRISDDLDVDPQHKKFMVDTRKWIASRFDRKRFGDKVQQDNISSDGSMTPRGLVDFYHETDT